MRPVSDSSVVPSWFVVLPDTASAGPVAAVLRDHAERQFNHPSGRPWVLGRWPHRAATIGKAGHASIVLIGQHGLASQDLTEVAGRTRHVADVGRWARSLVGSSHVIASVAGRVRLQGTVTGVRRSYYARVGDTVVAADRADVLAWLAGTGLDEERLAMHLLEPCLLYPLAGQPVWQRVDIVPNDHYLLLEADRARLAKWWAPPEPVVPMAEGAPAFREALSAAVDARVRGRELISSDLGGLDSTSVCCLAARQAKVVAYTVVIQDPRAEDPVWAARTVAAVRNIEHHFVPTSEFPLVYDDVLRIDERWDEPSGEAIDRERALVIPRRAAARGSGLHLTGLGGDELAFGSMAHLHSLLWKNPRIALRYLRGYAALLRWPRRDVLRQLIDRRPYPRWLAGVADQLTAPPSPDNEPLLEWTSPPRLPPWATPVAVDAVRKLIRAAAETTESLAEERGLHRELETMRFLSRFVRQYDQMGARIGIAVAAPYYDDRVIEAGLAVRAQDRITPFRYKPLIVEAMRGIVPPETLNRQTKDIGSCDDAPGLRRNRADLLTLFEDSRLDRLGLIDAEAVREACGGPLPDGLIDQTVACEVWLRALEQTAVPI